MIARNLETGEVRDVDPEVAQGIEDAVREVLDAEERIRSYEKIIEETKRSLTNLLPERGFFVISKTGLRVSRVRARSANRTVRRDAVDALAKRLPPTVRPRVLLTFDERDVPEEIRSLAVGADRKYPTVKDIDSAAYAIARAEINLSDLMDYPDDPGDTVTLRLVEGDDREVAS